MYTIYITKGEEQQLFLTNADSYSIIGDFTHFYESKGLLVKEVASFRTILIDVIIKI